MPKSKVRKKVKKPDKRPNSESKIRDLRKMLNDLERIEKRVIREEMKNERERADRPEAG